MRSAYVVCLAVLLQVSLCMPTENSTLADTTSSVTYLDESDAEPSSNSSSEVTTLETEQPSSESTTVAEETENVRYTGTISEEEGQEGNDTTTTSTTEAPVPPSTTSAPGRGALVFCPELLVLVAPYFFIRLGSTRLLGVL